jgi:hypothetical protein
LAAACAGASCGQIARCELLPAHRTSTAEYEVDEQEPPLSSRDVGLDAPALELDRDPPAHWIRVVANVPAT